MTSYRNVQQLLTELQASINKLQAGNLTYEELTRMKQRAAELYERLAIIEFKVNERLLNNPQTHVAADESEKIQIFTGSEKSVGFHITTKAEEPVEEKKPTPVVEPVAETKPEVVDIFKPFTQQPVEKQEKQDTPVTPQPLVSKQSVTEIKTETPGTLAEKLKKTKIHDLKTAIPLNQKFLFMNTLFEGENSSYNDSLEKLNNAQSLEDARLQLRELAYAYEWDFEDEQVIAFTEFVERRHM